MLAKADPSVSFAGASALKAIGEPVSTYTDRLFSLISTQDDGASRSALYMLSELKLLGPQHAAIITSRMDKTSTSDFSFFGKILCEAAGPQPAIAAKAREMIVTSSAADLVHALVTLRSCGTVNETDLSAIAFRMASFEPSQKNTLLYVFTTIGSVARSIALQLAEDLPLTRDSGFMGQMAAQIKESGLDTDRVEFLKSSGPHGDDVLVRVVSPAYLAGSVRAELWALAYELSGGTGSASQAIATLRRLSTRSMGARESQHALRRLFDLWRLTKASDSGLRADIGRQASALVRESGWLDTDATLLREWSSQLKLAGMLNEADVFDREISKRNWGALIRSALQGIAGAAAIHLALWVALLCLQMAGAWICRAIALLGPLPSKNIAFPVSRTPCGSSPIG
jgi:hypothetical protein